MTVYRLHGGRCGYVRGAGGDRPAAPPVRNPRISWVAMAATTNTDREHVARAIELARRGAGATKPNPVVGAVIARDGRSSARAGTSATAARTPR